MERLGGLMKWLMEYSRVSLKEWKEMCVDGRKAKKS